MAQVYTHYDNLKVARNAPPEVIRAAYKTLSQKFHPDRNPGNADAARIMAIINTSYEVFVKLVSLDGPNAFPVRVFFIPAFGQFTLKKVTPGSYDIRYQDLSNGGLSRSEAFSLEETATYDGTQFSNITMTLYKVQNGNMQTYGLSEAEF